MGNNASVKKAEKEKNLNEIINFIATNYILTQTFEDLVSLKDEKYCDKLIIVTSEVLEKYLSKMDVKYLAAKTKKGVVVNEMNNDELTYFERENLENIDVKNTTSKKRMCIGIAKYYIKIAHIFSSIVTTINPTYSYKDVYGTIQVVEFKDKNKIPKDTDIKINKVNLCNERLNALVNGQDLTMSDSTQPIKIKPNFCKMNLDKQRTKKEQKEINKNLSDEPGIIQLERLYKDVYDYETGKFTTMSDEMRQEYKKDIATLYKAFTGKKEVPKTVTSFSDIPLRAYHEIPGCKGSPDNQYMQEYEGTQKQKLFVSYAKHVKSMMDNANKNKDALINILDQIFVFAVNPQTKKPEITISDKLTDDILNKLVGETQKKIIDLYVACETDFVKGLEIFENIIQEQIKLNTQRKIDALKKEIKS